jgi:hypothetical protein
MYVILRILKHMALVDFVTLPTYSLEQCALQAGPVSKQKQKQTKLKSNGFNLKNLR